MIRIDAREFTSKDRFYDILNKEYDFDYEVRNLDALFDQLIYVNTRCEIINYKAMFDNLGEYGQKLMRVFIDALVMYDIPISFIYE